MVENRWRRDHLVAHPTITILDSAILWYTNSIVIKCRSDNKNQDDSIAKKVNHNVGPDFKNDM